MGKSKRSKNNNKKRRKTATLDSDELDTITVAAKEIATSDDDDGDNGETETDVRPTAETEDDVTESGALESDDDDVPSDHEETAAPPSHKKKRRLDLLEGVADFNAKLRKRGVLYLARIPPQMGPSKVKTLLSAFGCPVTRVYLVEEDATVRKRRKKQGGGGGGKRYVEGWVELDDRRVAERVGHSLNNTPITLLKRSVHYGDLWNLKFLKRFRWSHLTEKVAYERRVKEHKLKIEMMQVKKENASYRNLVERGQTMDRIEARRARNNNNTKEGGDNKGNDGKHDKRFKFRQNVPMSDTKEKTAKSAVLSSLMS